MEYLDEQSRYENGCLSREIRDIMAQIALDQEES